MPRWTSASVVGGWADAIGAQDRLATRARASVRRSTCSSWRDARIRRAPMGGKRGASALQATGGGADDEVHDLACVFALGVARRIVLRHFEGHDPRRSEDRGDEVGHLRVAE